VSRTDVAAELERLNHEVQTCTRCDLHCNTTHGVPGEGPSDARIMLVGEGPGFNEDKLGRPFVGAAGKFLDTVLLPHAGLTRAEVYITNVVKHRPPNNRDPLPDELAACRPYLDRQIELINPRVIVTLGRHSLGSFFPGELISRVHGQVRSKDGRYFFHMYHPAAALHQEKLRHTLENDMKRLGAFIRETLADESEQAASAPEPEQVTSPAEPEDDDGRPPAQLSLF
jgi:uracil-DNA glycosylase family 4